MQRKYRPRRKTGFQKRSPDHNSSGFQFNSSSRGGCWRAPACLEPDGLLRAQENRQFQLGGKSIICFSFHELSTNNEAAWQPKVSSRSTRRPRGFCPDGGS